MFYLFRTNAQSSSLVCSPGRRTTIEYWHQCYLKSSWVQIQVGWLNNGPEKKLHSHVNFNLVLINQYSSSNPVLPSSENDGGSEIAWDDDDFCQQKLWWSISLVYHSVWCSSWSTNLTRSLMYENFRSLIYRFHLSKLVLYFTWFLISYVPLMLVICKKKW